MHYHAHIYFDSKTLKVAEAFHALHRAQAKTLGISVYPLVERNVGPHPKPMFEVHVSDQTLAAYIQFIEKENPGLSVLLHEDTGKDHRDHSDGARWFGEKLELDFSFFEEIERDPSKRIH